MAIARHGKLLYIQGRAGLAKNKRQQDAKTYTDLKNNAFMMKSTINTKQLS